MFLFPNLIMDATVRVSVIPCYFVFQKVSDDGRHGTNWQNGYKDNEEDDV